MLHKAGELCYLLSVLAGVGLLAKLAASLARWNFSPWWFWPGSLVAIAVFQVLAAVLMEPHR